MNAVSNAYIFSRIAVRLSAGSTPNVTIEHSTFQVHELAYRTSPAKCELVSRRVSRVDDLDTFQVDPPMLDRIRCAMTRLSATVRRDAEEYVRKDETGSRWFFQPGQDGWFALFDGQPNDIHAFHRWLSNILV
jgi:hypothetical protein